MCNAKIGVALVGGYFLGRTRKAKLAIGMGMFLAGKKLDPQQLMKTVTDNPLLSGLSDQVRKDLVGATTTAAAGALTKRAGGLADSLRERTLDLDEPQGGAEGAERGEEEEESAAGADSADGSPPPRRRASSSSAASGKAKAGKAGKAGQSGKAAKPAARKAASSSARKAASGAKRAASGSGGGNG